MLLLVLSLNLPTNFVSGWPTTTFTMCLPLQRDLSFHNFHISNCGLFFSTQRNSFGISYKADLVILNSFSLCLSVKLSLLHIWVVALQSEAFSVAGFPFSSFWIYCATPFWSAKFLLKNQLNIFFCLFVCLFFKLIYLF